MASADISVQDLNGNDGPRLLATAIISIVLSGLSFTGRWYSRHLTKRRFDLSDYLVLLGLVSSWGINALIIYGVTQGGGQHLAKLAEIDPALPGIKGWMQSLIAIECLWCACLSSIKISFLVFYRRTFPGKWFSRITHITTAIVLVWAITYFWLSIFNCDPVYASWNLSLLTTTAKCITSWYFYIGIWMPHILTDVVIVCLPQWKVWKLHVGLKQKIVLALFFLLGGLNVIASCIRFATTFRLSWLDPTWTTNPLAVWTCIEVLAAVASACLPLMRPIYHKLAPAFAKLNITNSTKRSVSNIWYNTNQRGRVIEVNLLAPSSGHFTDDAYGTLPGEEASQSFAIAVAPLQGNHPAGMVEGERLGDNKRILVTRSWDIRY